MPPLRASKYGIPLKGKIIIIIIIVITIVIILIAIIIYRNNLLHFRCAIIIKKFQLHITKIYANAKRLLNNLIIYRESKVIAKLSYKYIENNNVFFNICVTDLLNDLQTDHARIKCENQKKGLKTLKLKTRFPVF